MATATCELSPLEVCRLQATTAEYMMRQVKYIERFNGVEAGTLHNFIKLADRFANQIDRRVTTGRLDPHEAEELHICLVNRVTGAVLNRLHCDCLTPWPVVKEKLKGYYGGGKWSVEEDTVALFSMHRRPGQGDGDFAEELWRKFDSLREKVAEVGSLEETNSRLQYLTPLLKVHLCNEVQDKGFIQKGWSFEEASKSVWEHAEREKERKRYERERQPSWVKVESRPHRTSGDRPRYTREHRGQLRSAPIRRTERGQRSSEKRRCYECREVGHLAFQCTRKMESKVCFECGRKGHFARDCQNRKRTQYQEPMEINAASMRHEEARKRKIERRREAVRRNFTTRPAGDSDDDSYDEGSGYSLGSRSVASRTSTCYSRVAPWSKGGPTGAEVVKGEGKYKSQ